MSIEIQGRPGWLFPGPQGPLEAWVLTKSRWYIQTGATRGIFNKRLRIKKWFGCVVLGLSDSRRCDWSVLEVQK